jgi:UDP-GlcNAc:undecaprenyl-phosphate GlcNAc-1-phosphate transferase
MFYVLGFSCREIVENRDAVPLGQELVDQMGADVTGSSSNEYTHGRILGKTTGVEPQMVTIAGVLTVTLALFGALAVSLILTPMMIRVAHRLNVVDRPGGHKTHAQPVPYMGGLGMVAAVAAIVLAWSGASSTTDIASEVILVAVIGILFASLGFIDDLRNLAPIVRLFVEFGGATAIAVWGARAETGLPDTIDVLLSIVWIVAVVNAVNMLDHQDGLAAGVTAISAFMFAWIAWQNDQVFVPALCGAVAGASLGFLKSNFHPAKIYMGDSGAYFLGLLLAYAGLKVDTPLDQELSIWIAPMVIAVPVLDSSLVVVTRLRHRRNPLTGGKDHTSHRLMRRGLKKQRAVVILYAISLIFGGLALVASVYLTDSAELILAIGATVFLLIWTTFWFADPGYS